MKIKKVTLGLAAIAIGGSSLTSQGVSPGLRVSNPSCSGAASGTVSNVEPGAFISAGALALAGNPQVVDQPGVVVAG